MRVAAEDRGLVVYHVWPSLKYPNRLALGLSCIAAGLLLQGVSNSILPWILLVAFGNLLFLTRGYNNLVNFTGFSPEAEWQKVDPKRMDEVQALHHKMKKWDSSLMDVTSGVGFVMFFLLIVLIVLGIVAAEQTLFQWLLPVSVNAAVLFLPHWMTGVRRILRMPGLLLKMEKMNSVLEQVRRSVGEQDRVEVLMLVRSGEGGKVPADVKLRMVPVSAPDTFLGLQIQAAINEVNGTSYIYLYAVLVAKAGFGLKKKTEAWTPPQGVIKEYPEQNGVEVLVIRQYTTKTSGYETKDSMIEQIVDASLQLAKKI